MDLKTRSKLLVRMFDFECVEIGFLGNPARREQVVSALTDAECETLKTVLDKLVEADNAIDRDLSKERF